MALPWVSEFENNYDESSDPTGVLPVPDSNPYHILVSGQKYHVVRLTTAKYLCFPPLQVSLTFPLANIAASLYPYLRSTPAAIA